MQRISKQGTLVPHCVGYVVSLSEGLLKALKSKSKKQGIPYQRLIRQALEKSL